MFDDIRAKMNDWEAPAPEGLWDSIEAARKADRERSMQPARTGRMKNAGRKSRLRTVYAMATAAAAALLLLLLLPEHRHTTEGTGSSLVAENNTVLPESTTEDTDGTSFPGNGTARYGTGDSVYHTVRNISAKAGAEARAGAKGMALDDSGPYMKKTAGLNSRNLPPAQAGAIPEDTVQATVAGTPIDRVHDIVAAAITTAGRVETEDKSIPHITGKLPDMKNGNRNMKGWNLNTEGGHPDNSRDRNLQRILPAETEGTEAGRRSAGLFSIGISSSNSPGKESGRQGYTRMSEYQAAPITLLPSNPTGLWINPDENIRMANSGQDVQTETSYRLPVRTGITLRWVLPAKVGLETGITYTWLSSTTTSGSELNHYSATTQLHYVGIPLNVSYTFWESHRFSIYASAGGLMEKNVYGTVRTEYTLNGQDLGTDRTGPIDVRPLQWSVNATAGVQFNITSSLGIYAEPGAAYYFDDGTDLQTTYKARPFNFYLRFGLRFSFEL